MVDVARSQLTLGGPELPSFDGFNTVRRIGIGAASVIFQVRSIKDDTLFSLKHVVRQDGEDKRMIEQVENEYDIAQRIDHPYIRKVYDIRRIKRRMQTREVILVMEYCPGVSLEQGSSRSMLDLLLIFRMVADALNSMHRSGLVHCDIKPNNIIIGDNGAIRIIDLGQSCPVGTVKRRIQGTPDYIAPEQVKRRPLDHRTDVFNLGATMYWALTGRFIPTLIPKDTDRMDLTDKKSTSPASPNELKPLIPVGVSNLVMESVRSNPSDRPASMSAMVSRLDLLIHMIAGGRPTAQQDSK